MNPMKMKQSLDPREGLRPLVERLFEGHDLAPREAERALAELVSESTPPALKAAFLVALRSKGETSAEMAAFARGLLQRAQRVNRSSAISCVDTAGTGGDGQQSFNLSTAAALLVSSLGIAVAKHGNGSNSSRCGSSDLARALGLPMPSDPAEASTRLARDGFVFLHAPHYHPALAALAGVRRELGLRTVFNLLGPLVNPASPSHQLNGAATPEAARCLAGAQAELGRCAFVVHGCGFDEATPCGPFQVHAVAAGRDTELTFTPRDFGLQECRPEDLAGGGPEENAARLVGLFEGREKGPLRDAVCLNAALVLLLLARESDPRVALNRAAGALDGGLAASALARLSPHGVAS